MKGRDIEDVRRWSTKFKLRLRGDDAEETTPAVAARSLCGRYENILVCFRGYDESDSLISHEVGASWMADLFWLSDAQWAVVERCMPRNGPGARRVDDCRVISDIVHMLKTGGRWRDVPLDYGPRTTVYNRFNRWSHRGFLARDANRPRRGGLDRGGGMAMEHGIMTANLRPATPDDLAAVQEIVRASYTHYTARIGREPGPMLDDYAALIGEGRVQVAERDGVVQGVLVLIQQDDAMLLDNVAVAPAAQGSGLGRMMLKFAERAAAEAGYRTIKLYTNEAMTENVALYTRIGYAETHRVEEKGLRRVYMRKPLGKA